DRAACSAATGYRYVRHGMAAGCATASSSSLAGFSRTALEGAGTAGPYLGVIGVGRSAADSVAGCPRTCNRPSSTAQGIAAGRHQSPDDAPRDRHEFSPQLLPCPRDPVNLALTPVQRVERIDRGNAHARVALLLAREQTA